MVLGPVLPASFALDSTTGIWREANTPPEQGRVRVAASPEILGVLRKARDLSVGSLDLAQAATSGSLRYHLGVRRADLLRPVEGSLRGRVLEVGAACGALTRYLGETATQVVALEDALPQAIMARHRCRDLANVELVHADVARFAQADGGRGAFDAICAVDAFDATPFRGPGAREAWLGCLARCLTDDGALVLAADNRLGISYLAGAPEVGSGLPFASLHQPDNGARLCLGQAEWRALLERSGFADVTFYYPFPCHRFPAVILTEAGARAPGHLLANLAPRLGTAQQGPRFGRAFSEERLVGAAAQNGMLDALANAFLIVARRRAPSAAAHQATQRRPLAYIYSSERPKRFAKQTVLVQEGGGVHVERARLYPDLPPQRGLLRLVLCTAPYQDLPCYLNALEDIVNTPGWRVADVAHWALPWLQLLQSKVVPTPPGIAEEFGDLPHVPGQWLDLCPLNLLRAPDGSLVAFDQEWQLARPVPLHWIWLRGLYNAFAASKSVARPDAQVSRMVLGLMLQVSQTLGQTLPTPTVHALLRLEERYFWSSINFFVQAQLQVRADYPLEARPAPAAARPLQPSA